MEHRYIENLIAKNLIFYYQTKSSFEYKNKEIFYKNKLFFKGTINDKKLYNGELFDLTNDAKIKNKNVPIYIGSFNVFPFRSGRAYNVRTNICDDLDGLWINGVYVGSTYGNNTLIDFTSPEIINSYIQLVNKNELYKVKNNKKIKFYNLLSRCKFSSQANNKKIITETKNNYLLSYYDHKWQSPAITEKRIFELSQKHSLNHHYLAYPWATLLDEILHFNRTDLYEPLKNFNVEKVPYMTVCQHIHFRELLPLWKSLNIKVAYVSHLATFDLYYEKKYGIKLFSLSLYPVVYNKNNIQNKKKYFCSFIGAYDEKYYLSDVREKLLDFNKHSDCYIKLKEQWNYHDIVYNIQLKKEKKDLNQVENDLEKNRIEYEQVLQSSIFSLCPSGTGPNSIRLWESMSYGSIPVVLSNQHQVPSILQDIIIRWDEDNIYDLYNYLKKIDQKEIEKKSEENTKLFNRWFHPDGMHLQIVKT